MFSKNTKYSIVYTDAYVTPQMEVEQNITASNYEKMCESVFQPSVFRCPKQHYIAEGSNTSPIISFYMNGIKMKKSVKH